MSSTMRCSLPLASCRPCAAAPATLLLDPGPKTTPPAKTGNSALHYAAERRNVGVLRMMLDAKAPPDLLNQQGATPLLVAAGRGRVDAVRLLLERGASLEKQD